MPAIAVWLMSKATNKTARLNSGGLFYNSFLVAGAGFVPATFGL